MLYILAHRCFFATNFIRSCDVTALTVLTARCCTLYTPPTDFITPDSNKILERETPGEKKDFG